MNRRLPEAEVSASAVLLWTIERDYRRGVLCASSSHGHRVEVPDDADAGRRLVAGMLAVQHRQEAEP